MPLKKTKRTNVLRRIREKVAFRTMNFIRIVRFSMTKTIKFTLQKLHF